MGKEEERKKKGKKSPERKEADTKNSAGNVLKEKAGKKANENRLKEKTEQREVAGKKANENRLKEKTGQKETAGKKANENRLKEKTEQREAAGKKAAGNALKEQPAGKEVWKPGTLLNPLPCVLVSCRDKEGRSNIMTAAWSGVVNSEPPMVYVSIRPERFSYSIIKETGQFVLNVTTKDLARAADYCGVRSGAKVDKWEACQLTPEPASKIAAPLIKESPVNLECTVTQVIPLGSHDMFLAKVEAVDVDSRFLDEKGKLDLMACDLVAYSHGDYVTLGKRLGGFGFSVRKQHKNRK